MSEHPITHEPHVVSESIARRAAGGGEWHRVAEQDERAVRFACSRFHVPRGSVRFSSASATAALSCKRCIALEPPDSGDTIPAPASGTGPITHRSKRVDYGPRIDAIIDAMPLDATRQDWIDAACACLDQAGVTPESQRRLRIAFDAVTGGAA